MKIKRLQLRGIGKFVDPVDIDFERFTDVPIFLIQGNTGSGKTTLMDAITYALYARDSSGASSSDKIVTKYPYTAKTAPYVILDFQIDENYYRASRFPTKGKHSLEQITPSGTPIKEMISGSRKTTAMITGLIGLSSSQFRQTILLAQGKFSQLLFADGKDRKELLEKVFDTEIFSYLEEVADEKAKGINAQITDSYQALNNYMINFSEWLDNFAADADSLRAQIEAPVATIISGCESFSESLLNPKLKSGQRQNAAAFDLQSNGMAAAMDEFSQIIRDHYEKISTAIASLDEEISKVTAQKQAADKHNELLSKRQQAVAKQALLEEQADHIAAISKRLEEHKSALPLQTFAENIEAHAQEWESLAQVVASDLRREPDELPGQADFLTQLEAALAGDMEAVSLPAAKPLLASLEKDRTTYAKYQASFSIYADLLEDTPSSSPDSEWDQHFIDQCIEDLKNLPTLKEEVRKQQLTLDKFTRLTALEENLEQAQKVLTEATYKREEAKQEYLDILELWRSQTATRLAQELEEGVECPVCGSLEHPHPAKKDLESLIETPAVDAAQNRYEAAKQAYTQADHSYDTLKADLDTLAEEVAETSADRVQEALAAAQSRLERAEESRGVLAGVRQEIEGRLEDIQSYRDDIKFLKTAGEQWLKDLDQLEAEAQKNGFAGAQAALKLILDEPTAASYTQEVADFRTATTENSVALKETQAVAGKEPVDTSDLREKMSELTAKNNARKREIGRLEAIRKEYRTRKTNLLSLYQDHLDLLEDSGPTLKLCAFLNGENASKASLSSWVLINKFEDILERTSVNLDAISQGQLALEHVQPSQANRQDYLNMQVFDRNNNSLRDVTSLSGGETFYVALSLALALADTVREEGQGIQMNNMFIDEGFGTLDNTTRGEVLSVLQGISKDREISVGVISHVEELKDLIEDKISVTFDPLHGSTVSLSAK